MPFTDVLVVEDDPVSRRVLERDLSRLLYTVSTAGDGAEAWSLLESNPFRIVVSDWMMPNMDGLALCRRLRERTDSNYVYFIMLTAREGNENHHEAVAAGVDDFLTKPVDRNQLAIRLMVAKRIIRFATQARELKALLPICMYCKKIRDDHDYWQRLETYIHQETGANFSHGICPECNETIAKPDMEAQIHKLAEKSHTT
jgi:sigma-B regulation protein RsbU (phosphoserine phosphatase)